jgi:uncharacterized membrane protein
MRLNRLLRHLLLPDWVARRMLPAASLARIERAIGDSERRHRGQIRFALEATLHPGMLVLGQGARERAIEVFSQLRVWDTENNNGVLIYLLLAERDVEIVADRGIDARVGSAGWESVCREMEQRLRAGDAERAVLGAIERVSALLEAHFPPVADGRNELPDAPVVLP